MNKIHAALSPAGETGVMHQAMARAHGGFGKTVAAILYGHEYTGFYTGGRFFLSMENADFVTQLSSLGPYLDVAADASPPEAALLVKQALETGGPSLLILDNVTDAGQWAEILATNLVPRGHCRLLITTRREGIRQVTDIPIGRLSKEEAREVFKRFCQMPNQPGAVLRAPPDDATADAITEWLVGLAVAVAAVAARMKQLPDVAWEDYWIKLKGLRVDQLPDVREDVRLELGIDGKELKEYRQTLRVIDDAFDALPPPERRAVEYAALLPEDRVPAVWLETLLQTDRQRTEGPLRLTLPREADDPVPPAQRVLKHLGVLDILLPKAEGGKLLSLHRLWRQRINERAPERAEDRLLLLAAIAACANGRYEVIIGRDAQGKNRGVDNPAVVTDASLRWELTPLEAVCRMLWQMERFGDAAKLGQWLASPLGQLGRFGEAAACLSPIDNNVAAVETALGALELASCYSNLATILRDLGDLPGARTRMEQAIDIKLKHFDPDHPTLATSYSNLALILQVLEDLPGARTRMERAIAIWEKHFDPDHPTLATRYSNLATILRDLGDLPGARTRMERAIAIQQKHFDPDHPTLATRYNNLAFIERDAGNVPAAVALWREAHAIVFKALGPEHPYTKDVAAMLRKYDPPGPAE